MRVQWYGQSAFLLEGEEGAVLIDPFGDLSAMTSDEVRFDYPPIVGVRADLVLVTHEHPDHTGVEAAEGAPPVLRSTAGRLASPIGEIVAIASEHDDAAGVEHGPNTIFTFTLDGLRVAHFGDIGQRELRTEQAIALAGLDLAFLPVGGGMTAGAAQAREIVERLRPRWVVPMHYRTPRVTFLDTADAFLATFERVHRLAAPAFETAELPAADEPVAVVPASP